jgi:ubiquitin-conjugating enzyme E2 variant
VTLLLGQLLAGWLLADFLGGVLHWLQDRVLSPRLPILGRLLVQPQRLHHDQPLAFTGGGIVKRNWSTWAATALVGTAWLLLLGPSVILGVAAVGGMLSSQAHYWAHCPKAAPVLVRVLQDTGLLQSPKGHARHHRPPQDASYCPLTDLINPILNWIGLWAAVERLVRLGR